MISIRKYTVAEAKEYLELYKKHYTEVPTADWKSPFEMNWEFYEMAEAEGHTLLIGAEDKGNLVGYIALFAAESDKHKGEYSANSTAFYVHPAYRKQGIFTDMVDFAKKECKEHGLISLNLTVNINYPAAADELIKHGMKLIESTYSFNLED